MRLIELLKYQVTALNDAEENFVFLARAIYSPILM
jgi:hypothetical protein